MISKNISVVSLLICSRKVDPNRFIFQDVLEYYSYRNSVLQNATFEIQADGVEIPGCYRCDSSWRRGYTNEWCSLRNETGLDVGMEVFGYGIYPVSDVVGICEYEPINGWYDPKSG